MRIRRKSKQAVDYADSQQNKHIVRHHRKSKRLKVGFVILIGVLVLLSATLGFWLYRSQQKPEDASRALQEVLQIQQVSKNQKTVTSKLGFSVKYYEPMIFGTGYILTSPTESTRISGSDLAGSDESYSVIALEDKDPESPTDALDPNFDIRSTNLTISTSALKDFFAKRRQEYGNLSETDLTIKHFQTKQTENKQYTLDKEEDVELNGIKYKKLSFQ